MSANRCVGCASHLIISFSHLIFHHERNKMAETAALSQLNGEGMHKQFLSGGPYHVSLVLAVVVIHNINVSALTLT